MAALSPLNAQKPFDKQQEYRKNIHSKPAPESHLASTLRLGTVKWQSAGSTAPVPLYSADFAKCNTNRQMYEQISECLELNIDRVLRVGLFNRLSALLTCQPKKRKTIALSGITLFAPTLCATDCAGFTPAATIKFQIVLKAKRVNENCFQQVLTFGPHKAREGELTEVEFDAETPLESGVMYCIMVEEISNYYTGAAVYEARDSGTIQRSVTANVGETCVCVGNICSWNPYTEHDGIHISPQLIYKLRLRECEC